MAYFWVMVISTTDIQLYEMLKQKLGNKEAEALVYFVDTKLKESNEQNQKALATKEDISVLKEDISVFKLDVKQDMAELKLEVKQDMAELKLEMKQEVSELKLKITETKTDVIRWVFALFGPLMLAIIGLYLKK